MIERDSLLAAAPRASARVPAIILFAIELLALLGVLVFAWKVRKGWPSVPFPDADTWGYLAPSLTWFSGQGFRQNDGRDWLYPALLALFLKSSHSFAGILVWQRLLGIGSGILMSITWRCWVSMLPFGRWIRLLISLTGALPICVQLANQQNIFLESSIRPEAVLPFFVYAQLACVMSYCRYRWQTPRALPSLLWGAVAIMLAYACLVLKPSWYLACATTSLPVLAGVLGRALPLRTRLFTPILGAVAALGVIWLPGRILIIPDAGSRTFLPYTLFCVHAPLIERLFQEKHSALPDSDPGKAKLKSLLNVMDSEFRTAANVPSAYEKLRFDPDYLMHSPTFMGAIYEYAGNDRDKLRVFCFSSYEAAVIRYPGDYTKKICIQFTHFLFPDPKTFVRDALDLGSYYREGSESLQAGWAATLRPDLRDLYHRYQADVASQVSSTGSLERTPKLRVARRWYAAWALPGEMLFLLALFAASVWSPLRDLRLGGWAACFLFLAPFGNAVGVCIVHTLDIYRYRATLGGYWLFALTAMAVFTVAVLAQSLLHMTKKWARIRPEPPTSDRRT